MVISLISHLFLFFALTLQFVCVMLYACPVSIQSVTAAVSVRGVMFGCYCVINFCFCSCDNVTWSQIYHIYFVTKFAISIQLFVNYMCMVLFSGVVTVVVNLFERLLSLVFSP